MKKSSFSSPRMVLFLGDTFTLALTTIIGFSFHGTLGTAGDRLLSTFLPSLFAWLLIAPHLGVFDLHRTIEWTQLWRPFWAMVLSAPLAAWFRGLWLNTAILPVFVIVLGGVNALAILIWRAVYALVARKMRAGHG